MALTCLLFDAVPIPLYRCFVPLDTCFFFRYDISNEYRLKVVRYPGTILSTERDRSVEGLSALS